MPRAKSVYQAADNTTFDKRKDAVIHDTGIELRKAFHDAGFPDQTGSIKAMCLCMAKNYTKFRPVLDRIRRANQLSDQ
jgi:hypothetical protein